MTQQFQTRDIWPALLSAASKLGIDAILLRMIAMELPDNPWSDELTVFETDEGFLVHTPHRCGEACPLTAEACLTAFKVEDYISRHKGRPYKIVSVKGRGSDLQIGLRSYL